ncbi:hypothetical protein ACFE04_009515 [Oxalis oulophora]
MASLGLGFHPPQFSEDIAWLPAWLQPRQSNSSRSTSTQEQHKNFSSIRESLSQNKDVELLSREGGKLSSFHLFLSGEDNTPISLASPPANVLRFQLHFSTDDDTENNNSQPLHESQSKKNMDRFLSVQLVKPSTDGGENSHLTARNSYIDKGNKSRTKKCVGNNVPQLLDNNERKEKNVVKYMKDNDIDNAVELCVGASEALVIHELVSLSEILPASAVLEAALKVKQARLDHRGAASRVKEHEELDFPSDLDDETMADSFEDVGLSLSGSDGDDNDMDISQVQDTPLSGDVRGCEDEDLLMNKLSEGVDLGLPTANVLDQPSKVVLAVGQKFGIVPQLDRNTFQTQRSQNAGEGGASSLVSDKCGSRWLGGWPGKVVDISAKLLNDNPKRMPNYFVGETSFLSESTYVAPDENSAVQKIEAKCTLASQASVPFEGISEQDDGEILVSQEIVISSDQSLIDPLCSVVPCSISLENPNSHASQNQNVPLETGNCLGASFELREDITLSTSDMNIESAYEDGKIRQETANECDLAPIRRHFNSLRTYSMLSTKPDAILPSTSTQVATNNKDREQNQIRNMVEETAGESIPTNKPAVQVKPSRKCRPPLIVHRRMWHRLRASKLRICNSSEKKNPNYTSPKETTSKLQKSDCGKLDVAEPHGRKRVRFSEVETVPEHRSGAQQLPFSRTNCSTYEACKRLKDSHALPDIRTEVMKRCFINRLKDANKLIFLGIEFLLTGFSSKKEKDIELQVRKYGGIVLMDVPPPNYRVKKISGSHLQQLPIVICSKKLQTTKFLYGCAVNAFLLKAKWLTDSIAAGSILPPTKYMILPCQSDVNLIKPGKSVHNDDHRHIFHKLGIMLHGKPSFCTKFTIIVKQGGGNVFKRLQELTQSAETKRIEIGAIVAEDDSRVSRHLRHCALERNIPVMPASWIIKSLHLSKLIPQIENKHAPLPTIKLPEFPNSSDWSQEI